MPHLTGLIGNDGPLIDVTVEVIPSWARSLRAQGKPVPAPLPLRGLLDPGASQTAIDIQSPAALGLTAAGTVTVFSPTPSGQTHSFPFYDVSVTLLHPVMSRSLSNIAALAMPLSHRGFDVLLGRDVLRHCLVVYDGQAGTFALAF